MTVLDRINLYTLRRFDMIDVEKFNRLHAERNAGDRIESTQPDWTDPNSTTWRGLRLAQRTRIAAAMKHLLSTGTLNRADIQRIGEVSVPQASIDISVIQKRTSALAYDRHSKTYRLVEAMKEAANDR
jgi:hypothetical protein